MKILGVYREPMFSPGRTDDDARILEAAVRQLALRGHAVHMTTADRLDVRLNGADCVVSMAESGKALNIMQEWENHGARIINAARAVYGCRRDALVRVLLEKGLPLPESRVVAVRDMHLHVSFGEGQWWLKRGDVHSTRPGDVVKVGSHREVAQAADHFARNGIDRVVVQKHVDGEIIKFYGVANGSYFAAFVSSRDAEGRKEEVRYPCLEVLGHQAARAVGLEVFGGDAMLTPDGRFLLVDLNDWPSFSCCIGPASDAIATYVDHLAKRGTNGP